MHLSFLCEPKLREIQNLRLCSSRCFCARACTVNLLNRFKFSNFTKKSFSLCLLQIPYARSEYHLDEVIETVCKEFEEYAQAKEKSNGEPTIIRIMARSGGMNPRFSEIDIVPDDDLNTRLKFYVGRILCICSM